MLDPPAGGLPVEVCVNHQSDWELIYKNSEIRVKCLVESCETLLTAKRMSKSGLRFLAVRSGGCSHNLVEIPLERGEVEQDPSHLVGGGGPEGDEHLWMKGQLFKIARGLGLEAVIEHAPTRADVFLPEHHLALEYQRWDTDFHSRTAQRSSAGAERTLWMFPWQPPNAPRNRQLTAFNDAVFKHGGIYVSVWTKDRGREPQRPWEDASQERNARLYASGSIVKFDPDLKALVRTPCSLKTVLGQIISGERVLAYAMVLKKKNGREASARVWVLRDDLAQSEAVQKERRPDATQTTGTASAPKPEPAPGPNPAPVPVPPTLPGSLPDGGPRAAEESRPDHGQHPATASAEVGSAPEEAAQKIPQTNNETPMVRPPENFTPAPRRSWWKAIADWFR